MPIILPDLHGRSDLLDAALGFFGGGARFVSLGDAIDRGPDSRGVVRRLLGLSDAGRVVLLRGNHEGMLGTAAELHRRWRESGDEDLRELAEAQFRNWLRNGGQRVSREYGGLGPGDLPAELEDYLGRTVLAHASDAGILCSHAAPPASLPRYGSEVETMLWARPDEGPFPLPEGVRASVHGHTPLAAPTWVGDHLYADLGAVHTGALCALDLDSLEATVLQGSGDARVEDLPRLFSQQPGLVRAHPVRVVRV